jgi:hypothetical protein
MKWLIYFREWHSDIPGEERTIIEAETKDDARVNLYESIGYVDILSIELSPY